MRIPIRYFSIGLLTASIVLLIMYVITDDSGQAIDSLTVEELSSALEEKGYRTISQDDFISYSVYLDEERAKEDEKEDSKSSEKEKDKDQTGNKEKEKEDDQKKDGQKDKANDQNEDQDKAEEKNTKKATINVEQGFVSQDIAKLLKEEGIIEDESKFVNYMEDNGYSAYIQIGKFTVNSDMNNKELAETLTTYPGN